MTDERLDTIIGNLLRWGVALAAAVVLAGGVWYLVVRATMPTDYHQFHSEVRGFTALAGPQWVILIGLLILIATPVARVGLSLMAFIAERDWIFVWITAVVLGVLVYGVGVAWW